MEEDLLQMQKKIQEMSIPRKIQARWQNVLLYIFWLTGIIVIFIIAVKYKDVMHARNIEKVWTNQITGELDWGVLLFVGIFLYIILSEIYMILLSGKLLSSGTVCVGDVEVTVKRWLQNDNMEIVYRIDDKFFRLKTYGNSNRAPKQVLLFVDNNRPKRAVSYNNTFFWQIVGMEIR